MKVYNKELTLRSNGKRVTYHNIKKEVLEAVQDSEVENGVCLIQSPHTTCSVIFEEYVHDTDFNGDEFLQVDLNRILDKIVPREFSENTNYRYPGPKHTDFLHQLQSQPKYRNYQGDDSTILNGDAHIRASFFGASETFVVKAGEIMTGGVGYVYFVDWDQNRERDRKCHIMVMGE